MLTLLALACISVAVPLPPVDDDARVVRRRSSVAVEARIGPVLEGRVREADPELDVLARHDVVDQCLFHLAIDLRERVLPQDDPLRPGQIYPTLYGLLLIKSAVRA